LMNLQRHKALIESHANVLEIQAASMARELADKAFQEDDSARKDNQRIVVRTWLSARNVQLDHDVYTGVREVLDFGYFRKRQSLHGMTTSTLRDHLSGFMEFLEQV